MLHINRMVNIHFGSFTFEGFLLLKDDKTTTIMHSGDGSYQIIPIRCSEDAAHFHCEPLGLVECDN